MARQEEQLLEHTLEVAYRSAERDVMLEQVVMARAAIEEEMAELNTAQQDDVAREQTLSELERKLAELIQQQGDVESDEKPPIVLQHLPTPMAKTVFGKELHVMVATE